MLYFSTIKKDENFVGLRIEDKQTVFYLPKGFENFDENNFGEVKQVFFLFYKLFKKYFENQQSDKKAQKHRFQSSENEEIEVFGNFSALDSILDAYDEPLISALYKKEYKSKEVNFNKFYLHLHKAVYIHDVVFLEDMYSQRQTVVRESPPITALFCYIFSEIKRELAQKQDISFQVLELAENFKEKYLNFNALFSENFEQNIGFLKVIFEEIHAQSPYKDADYWHFFDAIENFLYPISPKEGEIWGISKFYPIWEMLCLEYAEKEFKEKILADKGGKLHSYSNKEHKFLDLAFTASNLTKTLRPDFLFYSLEDLSKYDDEQVLDLICVEERINQYSESYKKTFNNGRLIFKPICDKYPQISKKQANMLGKYDYIREGKYSEFKQDMINYARKEIKLQNYFLIDFKYHSEQDFEDNNEKISRDIRKQLFYEWTIQENINIDTVKSAFYIPSYSPNDKIELESFEKNDITVQKINLLALINHYL